MAQRNSLLDYYTTADVLNTPINRGSVFPLTEYANRVEFDPSSGVTGSIGNALMAPGRAYKGEIAPDQMVPEAMNLAGWLTLGGYMSPKPANALGAGGGGNKMAPRPEPRGAFPKAEAMGSDHIAEIAPDKYNAFLAGVESRLENGEWGPFYGPPTPGTSPGLVRDAYARTAASFKNDKYDKFSDQEQIAYGLEAAAKEAGRDLKMGAGGFYGSMYGDLLTPSGGQYKVRVADHANFSSAHRAPDFNIAPGAMTPDEFLDLLPTIYSNGRDSLVPGLVMTEAAQNSNESSDSLIEILRKYGLLGPVAASLAAGNADEQVY